MQWYQINYCGFIYFRGYQSEEIEEQSMQLPKVKEEAMIYKTPLKELKNPTTTGDEFRRFGRVANPAPLVTPVLLLLDDANIG